MPCNGNGTSGMCAYMTVYVCISIRVQLAIRVLGWCFALCRCISVSYSLMCHSDHQHFVRGQKHFLIASQTSVCASEVETDFSKQVASNERHTPSVCGLPIERGDFRNKHRLGVGSIKKAPITIPRQLPLQMPHTHARTHTLKSTMRQTEQSAATSYQQYSLICKNGN